MNIPNKLTVTRLILAPVLLVWFFTPQLFGVKTLPYAVILALLYAVMELTDLLDGKIARKYNMVSDLGKVMDPFSDALCHLTFFTCFLSVNIMPLWAFIIILWREFSQSFTRMLLMGKGKPMAANIFGKAKTCLYAFCSVCGFAYRIIIMFNADASWMGIAMTVLFGLAAFASAASFLIYIKDIIKSGVLKDMTR